MQSAPLSPLHVRDLLVRDADPDVDAATCASLYSPYVTDTAVTFELVPPDEQAMAGRIRAAIASHAWLVAERSGQVIGYAYASPFAAREAYRWACEVSVYCAPDHHRTGAGRALYGALLARLTERGYRTAVARMTLPNEATLGLHARFGFVPVGVHQGIGFKLGAWHDVAIWQRALADSDGTPAEPH